MLSEQIIRLAQSKERKLLAAEKDLLEGLTATELKIFDAVKKQISKMNQTGGKIDFDSKNVDLVNELDQIVVRSIQKSDYPGSVNKYLQDFDSITDFNERIHEEANGIDPKEFAKAVDPFKKQFVEDTLQGLTGSGVSTNFVEPLRQELFKNIVAGTSSFEVEQALRTFIQGNGETAGNLKRYVTQVSRDALNQYDGTINSRIAEEFGLDAFQYVGSLIDDSRKQCIRWTGKEVLLKKDLPAEIAWANNNGTGMIPGTNADNFAVFRGGYNCRHSAIPFKLTRREAARLEEQETVQEIEVQTVQQGVKEVKQELKENKPKAQKKGNKVKLNENQFLSLRDEKFNKQFEEVFSDSDGANEVANEFGTIVTLRNTTEGSSRGLRSFIAASKRPELTSSDIGEFSQGVEGFCAKSNRFLSCLLRAKDNIEFKKVEGFGSSIFEFTDQDVDNYLKDFGESARLQRKGDAVYKVRESGTGAVVLSKRGGKWKFFAITEAGSATRRIEDGVNISPTITHESGHLIQNKYDKVQSSWSSVRPIQAELMKKKGLKLNDAPTWYGSTNDSEFFTETYTSYIYNNEDLKKNRPDLFEFIEELLFDVYKIDKKSIILAK